MDRYKFCYGKKRGLKSENDQRWLNIYNEQRKANLIFSDDDDDDDDDGSDGTSPKVENKGGHVVRETTKSNQATKTLIYDLSDLSDSQSESSMSSQLLPSCSINEGNQEIFCMDGFKKALNITDDDADDDDAEIRAHGDVDDDAEIGAHDDVDDDAEIRAHDDVDDAKVVHGDNNDDLEGSRSFLSTFSQRDSGTLVHSTEVGVGDDDDHINDDDDDEEEDRCKKECSNEKGQEENNFQNKEDETYDDDDDDDDSDTSRDQRADDTTAYWADDDAFPLDDENLSSDDSSYKSFYSQASSYRDAEASRGYFLSTCDDDGDDDGDDDDDDGGDDGGDDDGGDGDDDDGGGGGGDDDHHGTRHEDDSTESMTNNESRNHAHDAAGDFGCKECDDDDDDDYSHDATTFYDAHVITSDDGINDATAKEARLEYPDSDHESDDDDEEEEDFNEISTSEIYRGDEMHHETSVDDYDDNDDDDNDCHHTDDDQQFVSCHDNSNVTDNEATMLTRKNADDDDDDDADDDDDDDDGGPEHEDVKEVTVVSDDITKDDDDDDDTPDHGDEMERTINNNEDRIIEERINIVDDDDDDHVKSNDDDDHVKSNDDDDQEEEKNTTTCSLSIKETSSKRDRRLKRNSLLSSWAVSISHDDDVGHDDDAIEKAIALLDQSWEVDTRVTRRSSKLSGKSQKDDMQKLSLTKSCNTFDEILKFSDQKKPLNFANVFTKKWMKNCKKIGEGSYAEVFEVVKDDDVMAIKVVPVRSDDDNDCDQQSFREILFEMTISRELAKLRGQTDCFVDLKKVWFVSGKYPKLLMDAWDEYDDEKTSENDRPDFSKDQHYVVLGFEMGGVPLEMFELSDCRQLVSIIKQVSASLSIAETRLSFEHRDLHLGNILVRKVPEDSMVSFVHLGKKLEFPSHGLKVTVIDYTLSRMTKNGCIFFKDLSADESLFEGQGDTQYDVYRDMRIATGNMWSVFKPSTNVLWLKHLVDKIRTLARQLQDVSDSTFVREVIDLSDRLLMELNERGCALDFVSKSFVFK